MNGYPFVPAHMQGKKRYILDMCMVANNTLCTVSHTNREIDEDRKNEVKLGQKIHNFSQTNYNDNRMSAYTQSTDSGTFNTSGRVILEFSHPPLTTNCSLLFVISSCFLKIPYMPPSCKQISLLTTYSQIGV